MGKLKFFKDHKAKIKGKLPELRVIYTDLDGTILNDRGCLLKDGDNRYFLEAAGCIKRVGEKGIDLVLTSGRNKVQLRYNAQVMGVKNYIAELGCELVYDLGKDVRVTFDAEKINYDTNYGGKDLIRIIDILKGAFPGKIEGKVEWSKYRSYNALFFGEIDLREGNQILKEEGYEGLCLVENGKSALVDLDLDVGALYIYNLMPEGVDKGKAIAMDRKIRGIPLSGCIALGDSIADISMAGEVQFFFLMGDSLKEDGGFLKKLHSYDNIYITSEKMNRGWVEVIDYLTG
ncbi:MAG: HAD family hydrolase [Actinomycetota bacterium]